MNNFQGLSKNEKIKRLKLGIREASEDPIFFIDRFLYTFNPKVKPYHLPFNLFPFQKDKIILEVRKAIEQGYDIFFEKCREMGATYAILDTLLWFWRYIPGSNFLLGSRKEQYVDNTKGNADDVSNKEESLFGKLEYTINKMYPFLLPKNFYIRKHLTYMSLLNPENGNVISGESSNQNFSRGGRFKAIMLDEFAFWENDVAAWGATADTTRCRIVLTTPGIRPTKARRLRFNKDGEKIKILTLPYNLDPRKTKKWLEIERGRRSEEDFAREIMINWETSLSGRVYPEIKYAKVGDYPYLHNKPLFCSWDFGLDGVAIQWWQYNNKKQKRLIDCYFNTNKPISFYFPLFGIKKLKDGRKLENLYTYNDDDLKAIEAVKAFKQPVHFGDPDVSKRSLISGTSTKHALIEVDIYIRTNPQANDFISRREKSKVMLQNGIEINQTPRTDFFLECIRNSRYPQRLETSQATTPINLPIHDFTSHHRTAMEFFAVNFEDIYEDRPRKKEPKETEGTFEWHFEQRRKQRALGQLSGL